MKRIVVLGGGVGGAGVVRALLSIPDVHASCLVNTTDNGGHSGKIRNELGIVPPGDIRRIVCSLLPSSVRHQYEFRDENGDVYGNTILAEAIRARGIVDGILSFLDIFHELPRPRFNVWPISAQATDICMRFPDITYRGQRQMMFERPKGEFGKLFLDPTIELLPEAKEAIEEAEVVIIAPSGVLGSISPILLAQGMRELIQKAPKLIWFAPLFALPMDGQNPWEAYRETIEDLIRTPDLIVANSHQLPVEITRLYQEKGFWPILPVAKSIPMMKVDLLAEDDQIPKEPPGVFPKPFPRYFIHVQHDVSKLRAFLSSIL